MVLPNGTTIAISQIGAEFYNATNYNLPNPTFYGTNLSYTGLYNLAFYRGKWYWTGAAYTTFPGGQIAMSNFWNTAPNCGDCADCANCNCDGDGNN